MSIKLHDSGGIVGSAGHTDIYRVVDEFDEILTILVPDEKAREALKSLLVKKLSEHIRRWEE